MDLHILSKKWFNHAFENPEEISISDINNFKCKTNKDYTLGGIYMIVNKNKNICYIGKSINYMLRLKQHIYPSSNKTNIDIALNEGVDLFDFYVLSKYVDTGINFFNRKYESILEHRFISTALEYNYSIYNTIHYGYL